MRAEAVAVRGTVSPGGSLAPEITRCLAGAKDIWVFAYGSLMWDPGFAYRAAVPAIVYGHHRRFCIYSHHHRGTPERPGLVLGLDRGGSCKGVAYHVPATEAPAVLAYLWEREMLNRVYRLCELPARLPGGTVAVLAFVVDRGHRSYVSGLTIEETVRLIRQGTGKRGSARVYLENTVLALTRLGLADSALHRLERHLQALPEASGSAAAERQPHFE